MRVAFTLQESGWTGGMNYLLNLMEVLSELPGRPVEAVPFLRGELDAPVLTRIRAATETAPRSLPSARLPHRFLGLMDPDLAQLFHEAGVDLSFQVADWYGPRPPVPVLAWIPDFQHRHLPEMFGRRRWIRRELGFRLQVAAADQIMLSSEDARRDCEAYLPHARGRTRVVPFAVGLPAPFPESELREIRVSHTLPERYFFLPNQFWRHKNHKVVLEALSLLKQRGHRIPVVVTGRMEDGRDPKFAANLMGRVKAEGLEDVFRVLGMVPYRHVQAFLTESLGLINPSRFEGWSTTVEEARVLEMPMLLSDLAVHREQSPAHAVFFDPMDPEALASHLLRAWREWGPRQVQSRWDQVRLNGLVRRAAYGNAFVRACRACLEPR